MDIETLINEFEQNKSWDKRYRLIIQLGKKLPEFPMQEKAEHNQITGCESLAWLLVTKKEDRYYLKMDSDTRIVKGLMMILRIAFEGKTKENIQNIDINNLFEKLGLMQHLSPSRANGLLAIVKKIKGE